MNLGYTVSAIFAMLLALLTGSRSKKLTVKELEDLPFVRLTSCIALYCGLDALWGVFYVGAALSKPGFTLVCYGVYMMSAVVTMYWVSYMADYIGAEPQMYYVLRVIPILLVIFNALLLVSNIFTHQVFFVNSEGVFHYGPGRVQLQLFQAVYFLLVTLYILYRLAAGREEERRRLRGALLYALLPAAFGAGQILLLDAAMYSLGLALTACAIFLFDKAARLMDYMNSQHKSERDEQMSIINGLAGDFSTIYSVDMESGGFMVYNRTGDGSFLKKADNSTLDYFKIAVEKGRRMIHEDDLETFLLVMDKATIKKRFELEGIFSVVLRVRFGHTVKYIEYRFANNTAGEKQRAIIGVYDIDKTYRKRMRDAQLLKTATERQAALEQEAALLERAAHRDIMTGLYNRRAYEAYVESCHGLPDGEDFVYVSMDVNGLKAVNDDLGHEAGDELIKGAAFCMKKALGNYGLVYRHGGDEFSAILHVPEEQLSQIFQGFDRELESYEGKLISEVSVSYGYVTAAEVGRIPIEDMVKIADQRMYEAKNLHYSRKGIDRRSQQAAYDAIRKSYLKILRVDLKADSFASVYMDEAEAASDKGFDARISKWLHDFAASGNVHPEDAKEFIRRMDIGGIREHFASGRENIALHYRRKSELGYSNALLEIIPAEDFSEEAQIVFLYVKNIC